MIWICDDNFSFAKMNLVFALIKKDYLIDFRQKYPIVGIALYIFATIYISYLSFGNLINPSTWNALLWIVLLFASVTGIAKGFIQEENSSLYYYFLTSPSQILIAKFLYNGLYQLLIVGLTFVLFSIFLGNPVENLPLFMLNFSIGALGMGAAFTLISAISSKTGNQSTMMALLGFPVVIPVLIMAVSNSRNIIFGAGLTDIMGNLLTLISIIVIIIALSFILFPYSRRN